MDTHKPDFDTLLFLDFELTPGRRSLLRAGLPVTIGGRAFDLLALLATHPGEVLSNRALMQGVWPNLIVEDVNVRAQIKSLRKLLGGGAECPWIVNVTGRGYCFTAQVRRMQAATMPAPDGIHVRQAGFAFA